MSIVDIINFSFIEHPNLFQMFQPIGGVRPTQLSNGKIKLKIENAVIKIIFIFIFIYFYFFKDIIK